MPRSKRAKGKNTNRRHRDDGIEQLGETEYLAGEGLFLRGYSRSASWPLATGNSCRTIPPLKNFERWYTEQSRCARRFKDQVGAVPLS